MRYFLLRHALGITEYAALVYTGWCLCAVNDAWMLSMVTAVVAGSFREAVEI